MRIGHPPHADVEAIRQHFRQWLVAKALQELARGVRGALEEAAKYVWAFGQGGKQITVADFNTGLAAEERRANGRNFPQLLEDVNAGLTRPFEFGGAYLYLQRARSCLEHQDGVVLPRHLNEGGDRMTLRMPRYEIWAIELDPPQQIEGPMMLEKESRIVIRPGIWQMSFMAGQRIELMPADVMTIAQGCMVFVQDLVGKLPPAQAEPAAAGE
ncbi:MAG: hypothetical protein GC203_12590 [Phenylobacterium sp.]|uniref:hypothetical protein n=1 Tax=Phenylobacterium sp. TaxID=1871053 RepID=UPI0025D2CE32|nr:hypothetical protein [Phenylobacterium sp.]MBI1198694.1 hypothetical protein [Phenylobacterium sp.]